MKSLLNSKINILQIIGMIIGILTLAGQMGLAPAGIMAFSVYVLGLIAQKFFTPGSITGGWVIYLGNALGIVVLAFEYILNNPVFNLTGMAVVYLGFGINLLNLIIRTFFYKPAPVPGR